MKAPQISLHRLDGGLRLVHIHQQGVGAGIFGIVVRAGSADESADAYGLAHLVEHTIFKGTLKRSSWHIINRMETVGGELNAFTTKEETTVYSIFPSGQAARAVELIADLAINSQFSQRELEKEREVVLDEIYSYRDTPSEAVFDDFEEMVYGADPLGHNILGSPESVRQLNSADCRAFLQKYYTRGNLVAFYSGPQAPSRIVDLVQRYFEPLPAGGNQTHPAASTFKNISRTDSFDGLHQVHCVLGAEASPLYDRGRFADALFANIIGGPGMNSLLNVELRERRGLVYTVEAGVTNFSTSGLSTVYFGCDPEDAEQCLRIVHDTLAKLADTPAAIFEKRLQRAKRQFLGQRAIASENRENRVMNTARTVLYRDVLPDDKAVIEAIESVSTEQIAQRALALASPATLLFTPK